MKNSQNIEVGIGLLHSACSLMYVDNVGCIFRALL